MLERGRKPPVGTFVGKNMMTPYVVEYGRIRPGIWYELSEGDGFHREPLFGVSIRGPSKRPGEYVSQCFHSKVEALEYLERLARQGLRGEMR